MVKDAVKASTFENSAARYHLGRDLHVVGVYQRTPAVRPMRKRSVVGQLRAHVLVFINGCESKLC